MGGFVVYKLNTRQFGPGLPPPPVDDVYNPPPSQEPLVVPPAPANIIIFTDSGFSPNLLTIKLGETVTFKNESSKPTWPASAMHPTHKVYPGSDIEKCGTAEESKIFDACRDIPAGGSWSFGFDNVGTWGYHDHLDASKFGKIIVQ